MLINEWLRSYRSISLMFSLSSISENKKSGFRNKILKMLCGQIKGKCLERLNVTPNFPVQFPSTKWKKGVKKMKMRGPS